MNFCKDCCHYNDVGPLCVRGKQQSGFDKVTGRPTYRYKAICIPSEERDSIWPWRCGKNGRYFERSNAGVTGAELAKRPR